MKKITLLLFFGYCRIMAQQSVPDARFAGLDTAFARVLKDWKCAGFAVAVVEKDKVVYAKGFGYADVEHKIPVTAHTQFAAGSCTKAFTCAALGILQEEDKLEFNRPVRDYLPQLKFYNDEMNKSLTVRDLMCHRTGLPRHDAAWALFATSSTDTLLKRIQFLEPNYGIREKWQYNNLMYMALGKLVEKLSGKSYREFLREKIIRPLGITNFNFSVDTMAIAGDRAFGYTVSEEDKLIKLDYANLDVMSAVGGINTSVSEMAKWVMLWVNNGVYKGQRILPADYVREAISSQMVVREGVPAANNPTLHFENYGLGWFLSSYRGHYRVEHGGNIAGFSSNACFFPTDGVGIVVFCNQEVSRVPSVVRNLIADRMLNAPYKDWQTYLNSSDQAGKMAAENAKAQLAVQKPASAKSAHELDEYEGFYTHGGYGTIEITLQNDSLFAVFPQTKWLLKPYNHDVFDAFSYDNKTGMTGDGIGKRVVFNQNAGDEIASASIAFEPDLLRPIEFAWTPKTKKLPKSVLQTYIGEYNLSGTKLSIVLKNNETLFLTIPNQPSWELESVGKGKFRLKGMVGYSLAFSQDVSELFLTQPNGRFKALKKKG